MKKWRKNSLNESYLPECLYRRVFVIVRATVLRVLSKIFQIDGRVDATQQDLQLLLVEHAKSELSAISRDEDTEDIPKPLPVYHFRQPLEEGIALRLDLPGQLIVRHKVNVSQPVLPRYGDVAAILDQIYGFGNPEV